MSQIVLGIESSCDETAAAVLAADGRILSELVLSQIADHAPWGGVVPEIAARAHLAALAEMVRAALREAGVGYADLDAIAATAGPGLIGGLLVGTGFAKGAAIAAGRPYIAINHLEAHALTARLPGLSAAQPQFPYLLLLLSGGHSQCVVVEGVGRYRKLGTTLDDAVGEAFDKTAKLLGLPYPGGPALEALAREGDASAYPLPRPLLHRAGCDFSFSGLKTAVAQLVAAQGSAALPRLLAASIAASFQAAVTDILADRLANAFALRPDVSAVIIAGGVAANTAIRTRLDSLCAAQGKTLIAPPLRLCTDNAVMVAWAGVERLRAGLTDPLTAPCKPRWPLEELAREGVR
ncbi:tRNA (adenosine(37)-N6)-threonylcarbamoyltransferase complex transferase subunit TsaD [Acidocella sp.]|uniref:tRNA (adenosine(37)-N6)-threonylcarbamoyltransferase complex transferase subunit TsaD n=1 Tax=Acidocella sp. TaxID=50710 RepID=UPI0026124AFC|nr:tRNA (adenosine(37)-N6)-threonylcarbamoyltransferase complex transferase subunit TsaD [Acidocella sp.]MDD2794502.1 tRNA (adenosine(37)-N6)-threonylcarbamoyltransferase complex transferase subunit TsaD [Acidocella sp.]